MNTQTKLIIVGAGIIIAGLAVTALISNHKLHTLERRVEQAKQQADEMEKQSRAAGAKAGAHVKKIE